MSYLLGVSFDVLSSPTIKIHKNKEAQLKSNSGWGIAWYPNDDYAASVVKDVTNSSAINFSRLLSNWDNFRSTSFIFKLVDQSKTFTQHNTQPFHKSYGGQDWVFCHKGTLNKAEFNEALPIQEGTLDPIGTTDSELAFCHILSNLHHEKIKKLIHLDFTLLHNWFQKINEYGTCDFVLSDGQSLALYKDKFSEEQIYYTRILPPHDGRLYASETTSLLLDSADDANRVCFIFSTTKPTQLDGWQVLEPGQLMVVRRAAIVWDSLTSTLNPKQSSQKQVRSQMSLQDTQTKPELVNESVKSALNMYQFPLNIRAIVANEGAALQYRSFEVIHKSEYFYTKLIDKSNHILRLQPIDDQVQEVIQSTVDLSMNCKNGVFEDVFGNPSIYLKIDKPYNQLSIISRSIVKIYQRPPDDYSMPIRIATIPLVWMPWQRQMMTPYLLPAELPESQLQELSDYAMSIVERNDYNLLETLKDMNQQIFNDYQYETGSTNLETTAYDVFVTRKGVCQDFANLFICLARLLSIPARYRVGYIYTGRDCQNKEQGDASHAWAEVYLPYIGWRGFDPTNGCEVSQDHIRVACGRHFRDATPTSGTIFSVDSKEQLKVHVTVNEISL